MIEFTIHNADALQQLRTMPDCSVDALVIDPPAGIAFMGKDWDSHKGGRDNWVAWLTSIMGEALRVLKPGAHGLVWALPRTSHWTATAVEDAGFEIRDTVHHIFGSGFPKNLDISKAIDREAGAEREVVGKLGGRYATTIVDMRGGNYGNASNGRIDASNITAPATPEAKQWEGWGTALKPAVEHWILCRKPITEKTVAKNVLKHGCGGLNIGGCRIGTENVETKAKAKAKATSFTSICEGNTHIGRWPANLTHDGSECVVREFPREAGAAAMVKNGYDGKSNGIYGDYAQRGDNGVTFYNDSGSAARFFYCAKASPRDRDEGLEGFAEKQTVVGGGLTNVGDKYGSIKAVARNHHPTVKNTELMRWLVRLITPPGGVVLDCFCGSGSTGKAAVIEGFSFIGIEQDAEYCAIAESRIGYALRHRRRFLRGNPAPKKPERKEAETFDIFAG